MKRLKYNFAVKATAWVFSLLSIGFFVLSVFVAYLMFELGVYSGSKAEVLAKGEREVCSNINYKIFCELDGVEKISNYSAEIKDKIDTFSEGTNWRYTVEDKNNEIVAGNYSGQAATEHISVCSLFEYENGQRIENEYTVTVYVLDEFKEKDLLYDVSKVVGIAYDMRYAVYVIALISAALFVLLVVFLFYSAGYKKEAEKPQYGITEKLPLDFFTACLFLAMYLNYAVLSFVDSYYEFGLLFAVPALCVIDYALISLYLKSIAIHLKTRTLIRSTLIFRLLSTVFSPVINGFKKGRGIGRTALICSAVCGVVLGILPFCEYVVERYIVLIIALLIAFFVVSILHAAELKKLNAAAIRIASGDFSHTVDSSHLYGDLRLLGESINRINQGLSAAVQDKMKSERFKTELITNVSHDLKTPLTSIISYVDLLKKQPIDDETTLKYIDVLSRQSARLKKLTDDLFEAAMASSGNVKMELSRCDVGVLLTQTVGEFEDRLKAAGLITVLNLPSEPVFITADPKRLWRVFENLMGNICKYSLSNTRVYLDVEKQGKQAVIRFKNISKEMLNISGNELTARFVRGDSSRNTEGSGLGLSIAKSLTELQNGNLLVRIDGDLFQIIITFASAE